MKVKAKQDFSSPRYGFRNEGETFEMREADVQALAGIVEPVAEYSTKVVRETPTTEKPKRRRKKKASD